MPPPSPWSWSLRMVAPRAAHGTTTTTAATTTASSRLLLLLQSRFSQQQVIIPAVAQQQQRRRTMASYSRTKFKLNTGAEMPAVGFGTWQDKDAQEDAVCEALKVGYRHVDTARVYGTEPAVARAIKKSGVLRSDVFLVTKLWNNSHHPDDVERACDASLRDLDTDYVDLYLMHWPSAFARGEELFPKEEDGSNRFLDVDYVDTYQAMEKLVATGKCRAIGVSNFSQHELSRLLQHSSIVPAAHQLELHPYLAQPSFAAFHRAHGILITQYSPFGNQNATYSKGQNTAKLIDDPVLVEIGAKYGGWSGAQVALAWGVAKGHSVIPKSKTPERIRANFDGAELRLQEEDVRRIDALDRKLRFNDPSKAFKYRYYADLDGKEE